MARTHTILHCRTPRCRDRSVLGVMSGSWRVVRELDEGELVGPGEHMLPCPSRHCQARWLVVQDAERVA